MRGWEGEEVGEDLREELGVLLVFFFYFLFFFFLPLSYHKEGFNFFFL